MTAFFNEIGLAVIFDFELRKAFLKIAIYANSVSHLYNVNYKENNNK